MAETNDIDERHSLDLKERDNERVQLRELLLAGAESEAATIDYGYFENLRSRARSAMPFS